MTRKEAAEYLHITIRFLDILISRKIIGHFRLGRRVFLYKDDIKALVRRNTVERLNN